MTLIFFDPFHNRMWAQEGKHSFQDTMHCLEPRWLTTRKEGWLTTASCPDTNQFDVSAQNRYQMGKVLVRKHS